MSIRHTFPNLWANEEISRGTLQQNSLIISKLIRPFFSRRLLQRVHNMRQASQLNLGWANPRRPDIRPWQHVHEVESRTVRKRHPDLPIRPSQNVALN